MGSGVRASFATGRRPRAALRAVSVVAVLGLLVAELASLHHLAAASSCVDPVATSEASRAGEFGGAGDAAEMFAAEPLAAHDLDHTGCHLCRSSRDRFAAVATRGAYAQGPVDHGAVSHAPPGDERRAQATYAVAPKTSPPA